MGDTKGEIKKWRLLATDGIDKERYSEILKGLMSFKNNPKAKDYELPTNSIMLEGVIPIDEKYCDCIRTSWLRKIEKVDGEGGTFHTTTKSGSVYEFRLCNCDWLMTFAFGEISQFGAVEIWFPNKARF